jgi:hypothetical protein
MNKNIAISFPILFVMYYFLLILSDKKYDEYKNIKKMLKTLIPKNSIFPFKKNV